MRNRLTSGLVCGISAVELNLEEGLMTERSLINFRKVAASERMYDCGGGKKASKGEPQERSWNGIGPANLGGSKTPRG
jgi:hypothetical protein